MKVLLMQPPQERGLGFRSLAAVEPLGLESIAANLPGHSAIIPDLHPENHPARTLDELQPGFCGLNGSFPSDVYQTLDCRGV